MTELAVLETARPNRTATLVRRVREMVAAGRVHAARPLLGALKALAAPAPELAELEGMLLLREGRAGEALAGLDAAIEATPESAALRLCRADARMQSGDPAAAAADAAEAVCLDRANTQAKAVLGVTLIELGQFEDAASCLREAVAAEPHRAAFRHGLATALERRGSTDDAASVLAEGIRLAPGDVSFRTASMMIAMRQRQFEKVTSLARAAQQAGAVDACVFGLLGHALSSLARHGDALDAYTEALKLAPEDPYVRHLVTAGGVLPHAARAPAEYLETVFDGYAERFEHHLIGLGYRVPGLVRNALLAHVPIPGNGVAGPVLDLGCGTGLVGVVLSDLPFGPLVGVDLSGAMLEQARAKSLYAELHQADLEAVLADDTRNWPVIVAADVFCYFGDLAPVLSQAARRLVPGGVMVFSVEELLAGAEPWRLGRQGRYAHSRAHVLEAVAGTELALRELRPETLRYEADTAVSGMLVVLERPNHGS